MSGMVRGHLLAGGFGRSSDPGPGHIEEAVGAKLQPTGCDQAPREDGRIRGETVDLVRLNAPRFQWGEGQGGQGNYEQRRPPVPWSIVSSLCSLHTFPRSSRSSTGTAPSNGGMMSERAQETSEAAA